MRLSQSNKIAMYDAVIVYLKEHPDQLNSIAEFPLSLTQFESTVQEIKAKEVVRQGAAAGKTDVKYLAEEALIQSAVGVASSLFAYAKKRGLTELKVITDISARKLDRMKEADLITKCTQIYNETKKVETDIAGFGLGSREIETLKARIDAYSAAAGKRDSSIADRIGTGSSIVELFNKADDILEDEIDRFTEKFINRDKTFYDGYNAARNIKDLGKRHNGKEEGTPAATETATSN